MDWAVGMIAAPRQSSESIHRSYESCVANGLNPLIFAEPGTNVPEAADTICRPFTIAQRLQYVEPSQSGKFGNCQNYLQCAADLLEEFKTHQVILIVEDDAVLCSGSVSFVDGLCWPDEQCGAISLYAANVSSIRAGMRSEFRRMPRKYFMGSLAIAWRRECLEGIVRAGGFRDWHGDAGQRANPKIPRSDIKGVDTMLAVEMHKLNYDFWTFTRSLVNHHVPRGLKDNSALNNGPSIGRRATFRYVGDSPGNLRSVFGIRPTQ
jgi:hypothetical protein